MSVFSQKLQALIQPRIDKGQLTIYGLARNSKIDRSSLYKFINGERLPASTEILSRLVDALRLSPTQAFELRAAYDISRMGEERYRRRRHTLEFLNFFNQYVGTQPAETLPPPEPPPLPSGCSEVRTGVLPVNNLVQAVVGAETARPNGEILVIAQPDYDFLIHTLSALTLGRECSVQHILCLENESQEEDNHYNLGCLRAVVELMFSLKSYQPYYYYDNITSHFKNSNSLPYLIVTSECALQLSYNQKYAVCLRGAEYVAFFRKLFNDARKNANLMLSTLDTVTDNIRFYQNIFQKCAAPHWVCSCSPHILQSMDRGSKNTSMIFPAGKRSSKRFSVTAIGRGLFYKKSMPISAFSHGKASTISAVPGVSGKPPAPSTPLWSRATAGNFSGAFAKNSRPPSKASCCAITQHPSRHIWK